MLLFLSRRLLKVASCRASLLIAKNEKENFHGTTIEQESTQQFFTEIVHKVAQRTFVVFTRESEQQIANCRRQLTRRVVAKLGPQSQNRTQLG